MTKTKVIDKPRIFSPPALSPDLKSAQYQVINKPHPQVDALSKVTGKRKFLSDIRMQDMLWGQVLRSPYPHARIKKIDTRRALRVPGVRAVITAEDTPHNPCGPFVPDWQILPQEKVIYAGQPVVAIAALDPASAAEATGLVEVEYEEMKAVFDPVEAMAPGAPMVHEEKEGNIASTFSVDKGDVEAAFEGSAYVREGTFYPSSQFHAYLEPNGAIASYDPVSGSYTLWAATQTPYSAWLLYSRALGIEQKKLRLIQSPMGGAFGGKFESIYHLIAACLSKKAERPVRLVNTYPEEFVTAPLRLPMRIRLKMGIRKDGVITAREVEVIADNGAFTYWGPGVLSTACYRLDSLYRIPNSRAKGYLVYTNNVPKGALRGFGQPQSLFAAEAILDMLAEDAAIDPGELRLKNAFKNGEVTIHGWVIGSCGLPECIKEAQEKSDWHKKRKRYTTQAGPKRRGVGLACCNHVSGNRACLREFDGSSAIVKVGPDGQITVLSGEVDMGQGYTTVAAQCAAEELGVPVTWVEVAPVDSQKSILGIGGFASRATVMGGHAIRMAASEARQKILKAAGVHLNKDPDTLMLKQGKLLDKGSGATLAEFNEIIPKLAYIQAGQPFMGMGHYVPNTVLADPETKYGNPSPCYPFACHIADVEVDTETGQVEVINYVAANDVGKAINPLLVQGQLEGGVVQAMGYGLTENLAFDNGVIVNKNLADYKIPTILDMPEIKTVIVEEEDPYGPYGAKSVGEAATDPVVAAICNAIYNAVGVRITSLPVTSESLLKGIRAKEKGSERGKQGD
jgi:CO/xanthine dehydrogenase Mo-binding subunit